MAFEIDAAEVVSQYGSYYGAEGNEERLLGELHLKTNTAETAMPYIVEETYVKNVGAELNEIIQAYQDEWTPKGTLKFTPMPITLFNIKIDMEMNPDKLKATYLGFLASIVDNERANWPFVRWFMEVHVAKRSRDDRERYAYGKGRFVAPVSGTAGSASEVMDGIVKLAEDAIAAGGTEITGITDITAANAFDMVEKMQDALPGEFEGEDIVYLSPTKYVRNYYRDKRNTHGSDVDYASGNPTLDFSNILGQGGHRLVPLQSLDGTDTVIITPRSNFAHLRRAGYRKPFKVESQKRSVSVFNDWFEGFGLLNANHVYAYKKGGFGSGSGV